MYDLIKIRKTELGEKIEHEIRYALGQRLTTTSDGKQAKHLRFEMGGDRDTDTDYYMNLSVFSHFNFPLFLDLIYNKNKIPIKKNHSHSFVFNKGNGELLLNGEIVHSFGGYGTIDILIWLVYYFGDFDNFIKVK